MIKNFLLAAFILSSTVGLGQVKSDAALSAQSDVIRNEVTPKANTNVRIANMYQAIIDSKLNVNENQYVIASGTNTYIAALNPAITSYNAGLKVYVNFANTNSGSATLNLNSLGPKSITKNGASVSAGELSGIKLLVYNGTNFEVISGVASATVPDGDKGDLSVLSGVYTLDAGVVTYSKFQPLGGLSIFGRASNSSGVGAEITASQDGQVLVRSGSSIGFGALSLSNANAITGILPVGNGGIGLALGSSNQLLAVNNAGNGLQYKTLSISATPVSNDVGLVLSNSAAIEIHLPTATSTVRGLLSSSDFTTFTNKANLNSPNLTGVPTAPTATFGTSTTQIATTDFVQNAVSGGVGGYTPQTRQLNTTFPLSGGGDLSGNRTLSIADAVADGVTKGAPAFNANHFDAATGIISLDVTNGPTATGSTKGFLTSADFTTFSGFSSKVSTLTFSLGTTGAAPNVSGSPTSGANPTITFNLPVMAASGVTSGILNNTTQTLPGAKTFSSALTASAGFTGAGTLKWDLGSDATGDLFYRNSSGNFARLAVGTSKYVLSSSGGLPAWVDPAVLPPVFKTASYVFAAGDQYQHTFTNVATANTLTINTGIFPVGTFLYITQFGPGTTTLTPGSGVTFFNSTGTYTGTQYAAITLYQYASNSWIAYNGGPGGGGGSATWGGITGSLLSQTDLVAALNLKADKLGPPNIQSGNYTLVTGDDAKTNTLKSSSSATFTIPANTFPIGGFVSFVNDSTGILTIAAGAGASIKSATGTFTLDKYTSGVAWQIASNQYILFNGSPPILSGVVTLSSGSAVVSTSKVTASSRIFLTGQSGGGTPGWHRVSARTAGTSFTITSSSGSDTSVVAWMIIEP